MKNILFFLLLPFIGISQVSEGFNYQGVIRNNQGELLNNQNVTLSFGIIQSEEANAPIYSEEHITTTDDLGQVSLVIGNGNVLTGNFSSIDWSLSPYFLSISLDTGSGFSDLGTLQLFSVPFAMYAQTSGSIPSLIEVLEEGNNAEQMKIENIASPENDMDAANKIYVDSQISLVVEEFSSNQLPEANNVGDMLFWDGEDWAAIPVGQEGQSLTICDGVPTWVTNGECPQDPSSPDWPIDNSTQVVEVTSTTGKIWMDRNLGATNVATNVQNESAYGHLYQWGRSADGHQIRTSTTTTTVSTVLVPEHGNFISGNSNWLNTINNSLWQGVDGENNPCPLGFRLPTSAEWDAERVSWTSSNANAAFASVLKLTVGGRREHGTGNLFSVNNSGYYWSSTIDGDFAQVLNITSSLAQIVPFVRARAYSVRCIKD